MYKNIKIIYFKNNIFLYWDKNKFIPQKQVQCKTGTGYNENTHSKVEINLSEQYYHGIEIEYVVGHIEL